MLARIEVAYLGILRVVLLIAATLALVVTVGAVVTALPALGDLTGISGHERTRGGTLREFVDANKITDVQPSNEEAKEAPSRFPLPPALAEASRNFARYDGRNGGDQAAQDKWDDLFRSILTEKVPLQLQDDYGEDVLRLSNQLDRSKGKPLSNERLLQLIQYHLDTFLSNAQASETAKAAGIAGSMSKLVIAGGAFLIFVLVLFSFLFVKIERNLRIRHASSEPAGWEQ